LVPAGSRNLYQRDDEQSYGPGRKDGRRSGKLEHRTAAIKPPFRSEISKTQVNSEPNLQYSLAWIALILTWLEPGSLKVTALAQSDALASWNAGAAKQAITAFVAAVTKQGAPDFVSPAERIATFDKELAPKHPDWKNKQPFKAVLERDLKALSAQGEKGAVQLVAATHTGMSTDEFNCIATDWIASGREIIERG